MVGPAPRRDEDRVKALVVFGKTRMAHQIKARGADQPELLTALKRESCFVECGAGFDFDKDQRAMTQRHKVDFTQRRLQAPMQNAIAFQKQKQTGQSLGSQPRTISAAFLRSAKLGIASSR